MLNLYLFQILNGLGLGMIYFLIAVGLTIIFGLLNFVNFAHGAFFLLGAYICYTAVSLTGSFWLALLIAPLVVAALAWVIERLLIQRIYHLPHMFQILVSGLVGLGLWLLLERTRFGALVRAGSESTETVSLLGTNIFRLFSMTFALGVALAGVAGVLFAPLRGAQPFVGPEILGIAFVVVVIGGMGSFSGALVGGLLVGVVQSLMTTLWPQGASLMIYGAMAVVILVRPYGLFGRA